MYQARSHSFPAESQRERESYSSRRILDEGHENIPTPPFHSWVSWRMILSSMILFFTLPFLFALHVLVSPTAACGEYVLLINTSPNETIPQPLIIGDGQANDTSTYLQLTLPAEDENSPSPTPPITHPFPNPSILTLPLLHTTRPIMENLTSYLPPGTYTLSLTPGRIGNGLNDWEDQIRITMNTTTHVYAYHRSAHTRLILLPENISFPSCENLTGLLRILGNTANHTMRLPSPYPAAYPTEHSFTNTTHTPSNHTTMVNTPPLNTSHTPTHQSLNQTSHHVSNQSFNQSTLESYQPTIHPITLNTSSPMNMSPPALPDVMVNETHTTLPLFPQTQPDQQNTASSCTQIENLSASQSSSSFQENTSHAAINSSPSQLMNESSHTSTTAESRGMNQSCTRMNLPALPSQTRILLSDFLRNLSQSCAPFSFTLPLSQIILSNGTLHAYEKNITFTSCPPREACRIQVSLSPFQTGRIQYAIRATGTYAYYWTLPSGKRISPVRTSRSTRMKYFTPRLSEESAVLFLHVTTLDCPLEKTIKVGWIHPPLLNRDISSTSMLVQNHSQSPGRGNVSNTTACLQQTTADPHASHYLGKTIFRAAGKSRVDGTRSYRINTTCTSCILYACNATRIIPGRHTFSRIPVLLIEKNTSLYAIRKEFIPLEEKESYASSSSDDQQSSSQDSPGDTLDRTVLSAGYPPFQYEHRGNATRITRDNRMSSIRSMLNGYALRVQSVLQASWQTVLTGMIGLLILLRGFQQKLL